MNYYIILLIYCFLIFINYKTKKTINISIIVSVMWFFLSFLLTIFDLPRDVEAFLFVLLCILVFTISNSFGRLNRRKPEIVSSRTREEFEKTYERKKALFDKINIWIFCLNVLGFFYLFYTLDFSINDFTSIANLVAKMNSISSMRYSTDVEALNVINRLINAIVYAACGFCGFFINLEFKKEYLYNLSFIALQATMLNTKATLVFGLSFFAGGYFTGAAYSEQKVKLTGIFKGGILVFIVLIFNTLINYLRHGINFPFLIEFRNIIVAYFIGPFSAFNLWFKNASIEITHVGENTFSGIFKLLGLSTHQHGDFISINGVLTNVYTVLKHLISDFGKFGTILIFASLGWLSTFFENEAAYCSFSRVSLSIAFYSFFLVSFFSSIFRYNINNLAIALMFVFGIF